MDYDYSILELTEPISLSGNSKARAACLPAATDTIFDQIYEKNFTVSGWGALSQGGSTSKVLHHVTVPWVSDEGLTTNADMFDFSGGKIIDLLPISSIECGSTVACRFYKYIYADKGTPSCVAFAFFRDTFMKSFPNITLLYLNIVSQHS